MSSSPNKSRTDSEKKSARRQTVKMTSITRRLHFMYARKKLASIFLVFFGIILLSALAFAAYHELNTFGVISFDTHRSLEYKPADTDFSGTQIPGLYYCISNSEDTVHAEIRVLPEGLIVLVPALIMLLFRLFNILLSWHGETKKIRRILSPINALAMRADELSRMNFSEDKYQILEEAITHIDPEQVQTLEFGDSDLAGVEAAMNNLLMRVKESYQQQGRFVNDASHELRTPIAIIEGYANMLDRWGTQDPKVLNESIAAIKNESSHMKHLVEQLLFLARGDAGRTSLQMEQTSLSDLMEEIYEESLMIDEAHQYKYVKPDHDIVIMADTGLLKQAVRILVDNASKYTKEHEEIILSAGESGGHPWLQVQDNGIGMAEADIEHMFDRFYRSDEVRKYKGTGLGLSISKWIIDKHSGHFEITSRREIGTRIRIVL